LGLREILDILSLLWNTLNNIIKSAICSERVHDNKAPDSLKGLKNFINLKQESSDEQQNNPNSTEQNNLKSISTPNNSSISDNFDTNYPHLNQSFLEDYGDFINQFKSSPEPPSGDSTRSYDRIIERIQGRRGPVFDKVTIEELKKLNQEVITTLKTNNQETHNDVISFLNQHISGNPITNAYYRESGITSIDYAEHISRVIRFLERVQRFLDYFSNQLDTLPSS
jgi:hypothetical protein